MANLCGLEVMDGDSRLWVRILTLYTRYLHNFSHNLYHKFEIE